MANERKGRRSRHCWKLGAVCGYSVPRSTSVLALDHRILEYLRGAGPLQARWIAAGIVEPSLTRVVAALHRLAERDLVTRERDGTYRVRENTNESPKIA